MTRYRIRMRFRKQGDLRMISHRDLARAFERWLRRAGLPLRRSEGFHPKARMSFPSALALGIAAVDEVMEFELCEPLAVEQIRARLDAQAPPGLEIADLRPLDPGEGKARIERLTYEIGIPRTRQTRLEERIEYLRQQPSCPLPRDGSDEPVDVKAGMDHLELRHDRLRFRLFADRPGSVRPREVLAALGIADLETAGYYLTRTSVELAM
jgi:radical SAM-linked protein